MLRYRLRPEGIRAIPEKIVLGVKEGVPFSEKPPVRIFVGSETAQYRAERIFVWSIEQVRDPGRVYEIFLMKELQGFDRRKWLTGFTNYRFAIPAFAGHAGRAIYNDVDQIYLADPGELFDHELNEHGFLSIAQNDSSVMLMDCAKMAKVWSLKDAQIEKKNALLQRALNVSSLWGKLEPEWNARDEEYRAGQSKVLHYTALHTQPWHPFPDQFVYQNSPEGEIWIHLEEQANRAGFQLFNRTRPSLLFQKLAGQTIFDAHEPSAGFYQIQSVRDLKRSDAHIMEGSVKTTLWCHLRNMEENSHKHKERVSNEDSLAITPFNLCRQTPASLPAQTFDMVYSAGELQLIPEEDVPWILDEMFRLANSFVFIQIQADKSRAASRQKNHSRDRQSLFNRWIFQFDTIGRRFPHIHWKFVFCDNHGGGNHQLARCGGHWSGQLPSMWILSDGKVGHTTQSEALARILGWSYEIKELHFHKWNRFQKLLWGILPPHRMGLDTARSSPLTPPWPDIVLNAGWRSVPVARWIRQENHGHTRLIQLGRKGGFSINLFDLAITPKYYQFPSHPHRIELAAPLNQLTQQNVYAYSHRWPNLFQNAAHPRIALILGGPTTVFDFNPEMASGLAQQIKGLAEQCGGTIFAVTSPRTGDAIAQAFERVLRPEHVLHRWRPAQSDNPYLAYLTGADIILMTGDSESMLAEAASLGKPLYIIPLPEKPQTWIRRMNDWVVQHAQVRRLNKRGTVRPQQGLERLCARLMRGGFVQPRRDLTILHESLIQRGIARRFGEPFQNGHRPQLSETEFIAGQVKEKLGIFDRVQG
jgi:mitochondrial fission protein ELM1